MKVKSLSKLPKRKVTVDELLGLDRLTDLLQDLYEKRADIDQFVLLYTDKDGEPHLYWDGTTAGIYYLLAQGQISIMYPSQELNEEDL